MLDSTNQNITNVNPTLLKLIDAFAMISYETEVKFGTVGNYLVDLMYPGFALKLDCLSMKKTYRCTKIKTRKITSASSIQCKSGLVM